MVLTSGTRLGPCEILSPIGAGGMGEVYKAKDTRLDRTVAIKVLPEHLAESRERKARFEREAKAISQLNHRTSAPCTTSANKTASKPRVKPLDFGLAKFETPENGERPIQKMTRGVGPSLTQRI